MSLVPEHDDDRRSRTEPAGEHLSASPVRSVLPYAGDRRSEHFGPDGAPHTIRTYASDKSGTKTYEFNAAGFRGEMLDESAPLRVFVCGASYAIGTGLDLEETWSHRLKTGLSRTLELRPAQVNVLNFSQSLASANYVTRTLLAQCSANRPDLVIANFSDMKRSELFRDGAPIGVLPRRFPWYRRWRTLRPGWQQRLRRLLPGLRGRATANRTLKLWNLYARLYSREGGVVNTLTNMLLLQSFCQAHDIDCLISWVQHRTLSEPEIRSNPAIAPLIALLDPLCVCPFSIVDPDICTDLAADDVHPGPESNRAFAERLVQTYAEHYASRHRARDERKHMTA